MCQVQRDKDVALSGTLATIHDISLTDEDQERVNNLQSGREERAKVNASAFTSKEGKLFTTFR